MERPTPTTDDLQPNPSVSQVAETLSALLTERQRQITEPILATNASGSAPQENAPNSDDDPNVLLRNSTIRRSNIDKQAYARLHTTQKEGRRSVDRLKGRFESLADNSADKETEAVSGKAGAGSVAGRGGESVLAKITDNIDELQKKLSAREAVDSLKLKYSPAGYGYPKASKRSSLPAKPSVTEKPRPPVPPKRVASLRCSNQCPVRTNVENVQPTTTETDSVVTKLRRPRNSLQFLVQVDAGNVKSTSAETAYKQPRTTTEPIVVEAKLPEQQLASKSPVLDTENASLETEPVELRRSTQCPESVTSTIVQPDIVDAKLRQTRHHSLQFPIETVQFASPEEQHFIVRQSSSEDSLEALESFLADFTMDKKQPKEKKRSSSFRKILTGGLFGKDKKKTDLEKQLEVERKSDRGKKKTKKTENAVFSDNVQNEHTFNRNAAKRHTLDHQPKADHKSKAAEAKLYYEGVALNEDERRYAEKHINQFNQIKANFSTLEKKFPVEEYISMDSADGKKPKENNYMNSPIDKYIDTSSSSNTLDSENRLTYENALIAQAEMKQLREMEIKKENQLKARQRVIDRNGSPERFSQTPPRSQETYQNLQLIKPKALIPINSERPLPNPYHNGQDDARLEPYVQAKTIERNLNFDGKEYPSKPNMYRQQDIYGAVYDKKSVPSKQYSPNLTKSGSGSPYTNSPNSPTARSSPKSPTLEGSKLRLPPNREKVELQPRIKSPIPQSKISTDKIIATELLKNKAETKKGDKRSSPSHQRLEIDIDYPENDLSECKQVNTYANKNARVRSPTYLDPNKSPQEATLVPDAFEAARWQQKQRELAKSPSLITDDSSSQITTDATVHVDSPTMRNNPMYTSLPPSSRSRPLTRENVQMRQRSVTPVRRIPSTASLQQSPNKQEMRQSVEIFCWKELQKLKERQDQELLCQLQYTPYGFVEDPVIIRRSRSVEPNQQRGRRSASLPREARPVQAERNVTGRSYYREAIPENRPIIYGENDIYAQKNPNFTRGSPQRRTADNTTREKYYGSVDAPYKPIFNRGSLHPQTVLEMQSQMNKKVSFSNVQNAANPQPWPTRNGYVQSPPQRRVEKHMSVDSDDVFLPNDINQLKEINRQMSKDVVEPPHTSRQSRKTPGNVDQLYGSKLSVNKQHVAESYGSTQTLGHQKDVTDDPYVTRRDVARMRRPQNIYGNAPIQTQNEVNQSYSSRQNLADYGTRQNQQNLIDAYQRNNQKVSNETRQKLINESPYGTRQNQQVLSESPYGTRQNQQVLNESPYGTRQNQQVVNESPYGTRQNQQVLNDSPCGTGSPKESPYGIRQESPYGTKQNQQNLTKIEYGMKHNQPIESPYGTRVLNEPVYVTRTSQQVLNESPYATRANQNVANMLKQNQQVLNESPYGTRQVARSRPIENQQSLNGPTRNQEVFLESPYGTRQSVRQNEIAKEPSYGTRREMPPSGTPLYASKQSIAENPYGRSGPKQITVSEKVCDMYGKIHDSGSRKAVSPTNYNQVQQTGVIYGQLQTNNPVLGRPPQHQSYNQIPNNFPRGTRLTASANDMYKRYQIDPRHRSDIVYEDRVYQQRTVTEFNPDAPLPPTPNESKTKLLMMRRAGAKSNQPISDTESDTSEVRSIMNRNYLIGNVKQADLIVP